VVDGVDTLPEGTPQLTLGWGVIGHAAKYLRQPNGPRARMPWSPTTRQARFILWWYALNDDGSWVFNRGVRRLAKGSGKSPFGAVLALEEFTGPVRLKDFDPSVLGGAVGHAVHMPLVDIAATAESQTENTMRMVRSFASKGSRLQVEYDLDVGKQAIFLPPEGSLKVITASSTAAEGRESTFTLADETEHWHPTNGGVELAATLIDNLTKSGSRMVQTENAWVPGRDTVAEAAWDEYQAQIEGRTKGNGRILYDARIAPADTDLADEASLMRGLAYVYEDCFWQKLEPIRDRIWAPTSKPDDSRRKYLNQPTASADSWTTPMAWEALADRSIVVEPGESIAAFFDGSKSRDATALIGCRMSDGHVFRLGLWEPDTAHTTASEVDVRAVSVAVQRMKATYDVVGFFGDVREWESFVKIDWPDLFLDEETSETALLVNATGGKDPQAIAWDMRSHDYDFTLACELTLAEIEEKAFTHDGDLAVARHVGNARNRPGRWGTSISKESPSSSKKIDAAVCVVGARMVRRLVIASGNWPREAKRSGEAYFG
jgi:hypothetical protein